MLYIYRDPLQIFRNVDEATKTMYVLPFSVDLQITLYTLFSVIKLHAM